MVLQSIFDQRNREIKNISYLIAKKSQRQMSPLTLKFEFLGTKFENRSAKCPPHPQKNIWRCILYCAAILEG